MKLDLPDILMRRGIIDEAAVTDPDGYDESMTLDRVYRVQNLILAEVKRVEQECDRYRAECRKLNQQAFEQDRANVRLASERNRYRAALEEELRVASEGLEHCKDNDLDDDGLQECVDRLTKALGEAK